MRPAERPSPPDGRSGLTAEARVLGSGPGQARPGRATLPVGGGWQAPGARLEEEDGERKRQSEGPSVPGRENSTAKGPELRESKGLWGVESSWGWPWQGPRSRETGEEAAADAEGPPRASSGAWTLSPGQRKFLFVLQHLNTLILILFDRKVQRRKPIGLTSHPPDISR